MLHIHGTDDEAIDFVGGNRPKAPEYPSAETTVATWAGYSECNAVAIESGRTIEFDSAVPGNETTATTFDGCPTASQWNCGRCRAAATSPRLSSPTAISRCRKAMIGWLFAHPKP